MKRIITIIILIMTCLSYLVSCGSSEETVQSGAVMTQSSETAPDPDPEPTPEPKPDPKPDPVKNVVPVGFYTLIYYGTEEYDLLELTDDLRDSTLFIYIEFRSDGTAYYFFMDEGDDVVYTITGNQVILIFDYDDEIHELKGIIEDDTISFEEEGILMVYKLNREFQPGVISVDVDIDIIPPGYYTLIDVYADDGEELMPNVVAWEKETGISINNANHVNILKGNRFEQCVMQFDNDYEMTYGKIYMDGETIIYHCQFEDYDDEIFEAVLFGDILTIYADDLIWVYERNDNYYGRN